MAHKMQTMFPNETLDQKGPERKGDTAGTAGVRHECVG